MRRLRSLIWSASTSTSWIQGSRSLATCFLVAVLSSTTISTRTATAQDPLRQASAKRSVLDALKAIDAFPSKDLDWIQPFLEKQLEQDPKDAMAVCSLALSHVCNQDYAAAMKLLGDDAPSNAVTKATNGKLRLLSAINLEDGAVAQRLFDSLVDAAQRETLSIAARKSYCEWLGEIIGSMDWPEAKPPIDPKLLENAKRSLIAIPEVALSDAFKHQYNLAKDRTSEFQKVLKQLEELGLAAMTDLELKMAQLVAQMETDYAAESKEKKELTTENQSAAKSVRLSMSANREQARKIERELASPTPGAPIPVPMPLLPRRELILVEPFQWRWVTRVVDGRRSDYQIQEPRSTWDLEAERTLLFDAQMVSYNAQLLIYQRFQKDLADWRKRDAERRSRLEEQRQQLNGEHLQLREQLAQLEQERKEVGGANVPLKKTITQAKDELDAVRVVLAAAKRGHPEQALRPHRIDPWILTEEKNRLLRLVQ
jgi:hypothetical protein